MVNSVQVKYHSAPASASSAKDSRQYGPVFPSCSQRKRSPPAFVAPPPFGAGRVVVSAIGMDCFRRAPSPYSPASRAICGEAPVARRATVCRAPGTGPRTPRPDFHPDGGGRGHGAGRAAWRLGGVVLFPVPRGRHNDACRVGGGPIPSRLPSRLAGRSPTGRGGLGCGGGMAVGKVLGDHPVDHRPDAPGDGDSHFMEGAVDFSGRPRFRRSGDGDSPSEPGKGVHGRGVG